MAVNIIGSADSINFLSVSKESSSGLSVDTDTFLKLLVAQLQYQDPLEPQTDTQFVTQLAQMTSLEQLQAMNSSLNSSQAYDMIGKYVYAEMLNVTTGITDAYLGVAESVVVKDGLQYVVVGENAIPVSQVSQVIDPSIFQEAAADSTADVEAD